MADCLERGVDIMNITPGCIAKARVTLRQSLTETNAFELVTVRSANEVFGPVDTVPSPMVSPTTPWTPEQKVVPKRPHRITRNTTVHYGELRQSLLGNTALPITAVR